ncbi:MAG: hypothetical protein KC680_04085 [Candidatus Peregrinibacteria bacterium]|nr:hypothetical protein [Candidatus Peregrinibacteria bacterium]MCB9808299.1 hypothetical protein [Candidatus Peribacteria bacterium]
MLPLLSFIAQLVPVASAQSPYYSIYCDALGTYCGDGKTFVIHLALRTAQVIVIPTIGGISVIAVIWGAIKMMSSFGEDQGKEDAKKIIIAAIMGIVLAITGAFIVSWMCRVVQLATGGSIPCG